MLNVRVRPKDQSSDEDDEELEHEDIQQTIATKQCSPRHVNGQKREGLMFCFYAIDMLDGMDDATYVHLRCTPFDTHNLSTSQRVKCLLQNDESNHIHYLPLGTSGGAVIKTPAFQWPEQYTMLLWIRCARNYLLTTFDSSYYAPVLIYNRRLACGSSGQMASTQHKVAVGEWQCIIALGTANHQTEFRVGDLKVKWLCFSLMCLSMFLNKFQYIQCSPQSVGTVNANIAGATTHQLGNRGQGPGDVGCAMVFDRILSDDEIDALYEESQVEMEGACWTKEEAHRVHEILLQFLEGIEGIAKVMMGIVLGRFMAKYAL